MPTLSSVRKGKIKTTSQLADNTSNDSSRPADECPWRRPFPNGFDLCPVFVSQPYRTTDSRDRPLPPVLTCGHLVSRSFDLPKVGWYGACELGDAAARRAYLAGKVVTAVTGSP
jgi:hypothetical protein